MYGKKWLLPSHRSRLPPIYFTQIQCCRRSGNLGKTHVPPRTADAALVPQRWTHCARHRDGCAGDAGRIGVGRPFCPVLPAATRLALDTFHLGRSLDSFPCNIIFFHRRRSPIMLNALSRAAIGALKAGKTNLTPKIVQNELPKAMVATSSNCEYDVVSRAAFSLILLAGSRGRNSADFSIFSVYRRKNSVGFALLLLGQLDRGGLGFRRLPRSIVRRNGPMGRRRRCL